MLHASPCGQLYRVVSMVGLVAQLFGKSDYREIVKTLLRNLIVACAVSIEKETNLLIIECMKMLIPVVSEKRGKIVDIFVKEGDLINEGVKLLKINYH